MSKRRKYSVEFKQEAVSLTRQPGISGSQVAREIGVGANLIDPLAATIRVRSRQGTSRHGYAVRSGASAPLCGHPGQTNFAVPLPYGQIQPGGGDVTYCFNGGRYWARTSDPRRVKAMLYR